MLELQILFARRQIIEKSMLKRDIRRAFVNEIHKTSRLILKFTILASVPSLADLLQYTHYTIRVASIEAPVFGSEFT